jgi:hypothetical protein
MLHFHNFIRILALPVTSKPALAVSAKSLIVRAPYPHMPPFRNRLHRRSLLPPISKSFRLDGIVARIGAKAGEMAFDSTFEAFLRVGGGAQREILVFDLDLNDWRG